MINYALNNEYFTTHPDEEGMFNLTALFKKHELPRKLEVYGFLRLNNKPWTNQYKTFKGGRNPDGTSAAKTIATETCTIAYLQWIGAEVEGKVVVKAERAETAFGNKLMEAMGKVYTVIPQFEVLQGKYRIDFYIPETKQAFEYDESQHFTGEGRIADALRQKEIEDVLGCVFIRIPH